jgi:hypothetical protein
MGLIEEVTNNLPGILELPPFAPGEADSFFDIYFEIHVAGQTFFTVQPKRMSGRITEKPPGPLNWYEGLEDIPLVNQFGFPTGFWIGATRHRPRPPVEIDGSDCARANVELILPDGRSETLVMDGAVTQAVYFEGAVIGTAIDDDGDGTEGVSLEIVSLNLSGDSATLGPVEVRLNAAVPSFGKIEELVNNTTGVLDVPPFTATGTADSFFDVFFEVEIDGSTSHAAGPTRLSTVITNKPPKPGDIYEGWADVGLVNEFGFPTGFYIGKVSFEPSFGVVPGDANTDGVIDGRDVIRCKKIILGLEEPTCGADANEDGVIDGRDVIRIKKMILGIA